ncbi:MAG TPA: hypothetical protein PK863_00535 [Candidatus Dojkabacteria bacterium]|nr:hypothetical protein [Candidatus Dojkabacteria bacterium]HRP51051.1 hypothetical protein [Candidatus Dojkabacteria bacterium]
MKDFEPIRTNINKRILALLLVTKLALALAACGGGDSVSANNLPLRVPEPTDKVEVPGPFCGLWLNGVQTIPGTGTTVERQVLSSSTRGDLNTPEQLTYDGQEIETPECGTVTFTGDTTYMKNGYLTEGGAGFVLPPKDLTQGDTVQN